MLRRQKKKGIKDRKLGPPLLRRIILPKVLLPYQPPKVINVNHLLLQLRELKDPEDDYGSEEEDEDGEGDGEGEGEGEGEGDGDGDGGGGGDGAGHGALVKASKSGPKVFPKAYRVGDEDPPPEEEEDEEDEDEDEGPSPEELRAAYLKKLAALMMDIYRFTLKYIHFDEVCATLQVAVTYPTNIEEGPSMRATVVRMQIQKGAFEHAYNNLESIIRDYPTDVAVVSSLLTAAALSRRMGFFDRAAEQIRFGAGIFEAAQAAPRTPPTREGYTVWPCPSDICALLAPSPPPDPLSLSPQPHFAHVPRQ